MGLLLRDIGQLEMAMPLYQAALQARKETLGDRHPDKLLSIGNMGRLLKNINQFEEAKSLLEETLQAQRETLGDRHPDTLTSINNMGLLLRDIGQFEEAMPLYEEALQAQRETLGDHHPSTLFSINNMRRLKQECSSTPTNADGTGTPAPGRCAGCRLVERRPDRRRALRRWHCRGSTRPARDVSWTGRSL